MSTYYVSWLDLADGEVRSGRNIDSEAFDVDADVKREIAGILVEQEAARAEHRRNALMTMGTILMTQPSYTAPAPAYRAPVTCNNRGATITCF
ncbi:MAG: hypothetical protein ACRC67_07165 [Inquilinus sp.]|uniref:hypothetical protein n=1 Tax=Inquilinus sp. TaxID=1932117 RepID=UPI003F2AEF0B